MTAASPLHRGRLYDAIHGLPADYRRFVLDLCHGHREVLELGVGTGRLMMPLLEAGHRVVGIDVDRDMLESARTKLVDCPARANARLMRADLTAMEAPVAADIALFSSNTLSLIASAEGRARIVAWLARSLAPGARIAIILENTARLIREGLSREHHRSGMLDGASITIREQRLLDRATMLWTGQNLYAIRRPGCAVELICEPVAHAAILPVEIQLLAHLHGFAVDRMYGDYDRSGLAPGSRKSILILRREGTRS
jgi:SAM-dependent methyltransferase